MGHLYHGYVNSPEGICCNLLRMNSTPYQVKHNIHPSLIVVATEKKTLNLSGKNMEKYHKPHEAAINDK